MKSIFYLFSFLLCATGFILPQESLTAIITNPQIGLETNAEKLIEVVEDINNRDSISLVVVMGNITANGKFDEFLWAQEILDGLRVPYNVIGGEKDYTLSEGKGNEIKLIWGDDKFFHYVNKDVFIGLNTFNPVYDSKGYYDIETRFFLHQIMNEHLNGQIILIRNYNYSKQISNWEEIVDYLAIPSRKKSSNSINLIAIDEDKAKRKTEMPYIALSNSFGDKEEWKYFLIKIKKSGLSKLEVYKLKDGIKVKEEVLNISERLPIRSTQVNEEKEFQNSATAIWNIKLQKSIAVIPSINNNKICLTSKYGSIICLDNHGKILWEFETNGTIYSFPIIEKDLVVAATNEGDLFTININTGNLFQVIGIGETITSDIALVDIEYKGMQTKGICFGTAEGNFYCYELYSLELIWWNNGIKKLINSSVISTKGKVLFQDKEGTLYCLSSDNGVLLWKWGTKTKVYNPLFKSELVINNNSIYFLDFDGDLHCIDLLLGTDKWHIRNIEATFLMELNKLKGELLLHSSKNELLTVSLKKEKVMKKVKLPYELKDEIATNILSIDKNLFIGFTNGSVYEISKTTKNIFLGFAPIISLDKFNNSLLVTDYDGNITLLNLPKETK
ncbi:MAG: PQQ-binding-like beta-propeller repeat protein [Bacteroidetes bacterium]|nr:PQQ-binding-like beta-propeller repeat protein [Bacteroidota bacterium]